MEVLGLSPGFAGGEGQTGRGGNRARAHPSAVCLLFSADGSVEREAAGVADNGVIAGSALDYLKNGGRVFLLSTGLFEELETEYRPTYINFAGNNAGTVIRQHPALDAFPHEGFCDVQFYRMLKIHGQDGTLRNAKTIVLEEFPVAVDPIIRSIDRYQFMRDKGYLFEIGVGQGKLLVSTLNFFPALNLSPASQAATPQTATGVEADFLGPEALFLFDQLVRYALGDEFHPASSITAATLTTLIPANTRHQRPTDLLDCAYCAPEA